MADHNLRITAQLDTSELNSELDRLNQQRGGEGTNDTTGNGISLGMMLRKLQISIDNLNNTLKSMVKRAGGGEGGGGTYSRLNDPSIPGLLGKARERREKFEQQAKIGAHAIESGMITKTDWRDTTTRERFFNSPEGRAYGNNYRKVEEMAKQQEEYNNRAREAQRNLAVGGHFASMIGQSLQEAGYQKAGGAFNILGGTLGGAASGAAFGPYGVIIGGFIGAASTATAELTKMAKAAEEAAAKMNALGRSEQGQWFEYQNDQRLTALQKMVEGSELDPNKLEFYGAQVEKLQNQAKLEMENTKSLYENFHKMAEEAYGNPNLSDENRKELLDQSLNAYKEYQTAASRYGQWEELGKQVQKIRDVQDPYSDENHEKFVEEMNRQAEVQIENEEKRKQLLMEREQILLGIEQEYAQQGVDILTGMGKSGKYMSQAEAASTSQERYAPITKKLDTMQKSLDHLSQIDSKLRNLNIGLT